MGLLPRWAWLWSPGTDSQHPMYQEFHAKRTTGKLEETLREKLENMKNNAQKLKAQKQMTQKLSKVARSKTSWRKSWKKRSQKRTFFLALQLLLQLCRCFGVPATTGGKKPLCTAFTFATFQLLCQLFFDPWTCVSFNLTFFGLSTCVPIPFRPFIFCINFCLTIQLLRQLFLTFQLWGQFFLTFQLLHQLFFELSTFVSAFSNS